MGVFGGGFALLGKVGTASCGLMQFLRFGTAGLSIGIGGYDMYQIGKSNYDRALRGEPLTVGSVLNDLARIGMDSVSIAGGIKLATEPIPYCFVAGTLVATSEGQVAIEQIKPGDMVLAENPETGEVEYKEVLETYENETEELIHVHVNGEDIVTTPSHPFYVNQFGWTRAAQLRAGDVLVLSNGEYVVVEFIQHEILEEPIKVYNFEVEDFHTYFVGESSVLVHNGCGDETRQTWNEFQSENAGKYTNEEMSAAWAEYKVKNGIVASHSEASADKLRRNLINSGISAPNYKNAAHHIVAGKAPGATEAQGILAKYGIGINDAENGVFLPTELGVSKAAYHPSLHTNDYFNKVNAMLRNANCAEDAIDILSEIRSELLNGTF